MRYAITVLAFVLASVTLMAGCLFIGYTIGGML